MKIWASVTGSQCCDWIQVCSEGRAAHREATSLTHQCEDAGSNLIRKCLILLHIEARGACFKFICEEEASQWRSSLKTRQHVYMYLCIWSVNGWLVFMSLWETGWKHGQCYHTLCKASTRKVKGHTVCYSLLCFNVNSSFWMLLAHSFAVGVET